MERQHKVKTRADNRKIGLTQQEKRAIFLNILKMTKSKNTCTTLMDLSYPDEETGV